MKDTIKLILILLCGGGAAAIPFVGFYLFWNWAMGQIGTTLAYAGLIKVGVTLGCLLVGGSATIALAVLGAAVAGSLAIVLLDVK
jgi:hypothetical protein